MSNKIGILVNNLGLAQSNWYLIQNINRMLGERFDIDVMVFYEEPHRPCAPTNFALMQMVEAWGYDGSVVATTLSTAAKALSFPGTVKKWFYIWDLEWVHMRLKDYAMLQSIYANTSLQLLARSDEHARVIQDCWNRPVSGIVEDFNMKKMVLLCQ